MVTIRQDSLQLDSKLDHPILLLLVDNSLIFVKLFVYGIVTGRWVKENGMLLYSFAHDLSK